MHPCPHCLLTIAAVLYSGIQSSYHIVMIGLGYLTKRALRVVNRAES